MPAELASQNVLVGNSDWIGLNQVLYLAGAGFLQATAIPDSTHVTLKNLEDAGNDAYLDNVAPTTVIPSGSKLSPGGWQGPSAAALGGALLSANNLTDVANVATSRASLGLGTVAVQNANAINITGGTITGITDLAVADGGTGASTAANARTNLGLVIGTNVQAQDAFLTSIAALGTAADKMIYTTGVDTAAEAAITAVARALLDDATVAAQRATLEVLPRHGLIASLIGADMNTIVDQAITLVGSTKYVIRRIIVANASINLTTAAGGIYTGVGKTGTIIVAAAQVYTALTASGKYLDLTLEAVVGTDLFTAATIYLSLTTAQGAPASADYFLFGDNLA